MKINCESSKRLVLTLTIVGFFASGSQSSSAATANHFPDTREESAACQDAKKLQTKNYGTLKELNATPCPAGREASCQALKNTLTKINEELTNKIIAACLPPWMYHAAGFDQANHRGGT